MSQRALDGVVTLLLSLQRALSLHSFDKARKSQVARVEGSRMRKAASNEILSLMKGRSKSTATNRARVNDFTSFVDTKFTTYRIAPKKMKISILINVITDGFYYFTKISLDTARLNLVIETSSLSTFFISFSVNCRNTDLNSR